MTRESETKIRASIRAKAASLKEESLLEEAFSLCQRAKAGELAPYDGSMRSRGDGSSKAFRREQMKDRGESKA
jgi:hypothetical protein